MASENDGSVTLKVAIQMQLTSLKKALDNFKQDFANAFEGIKSHAKTAYDSMSDDSKRMADALKSAFTLRGIRDYFKGLKSASKESSTAVVEDATKLQEKLAKAQEELAKILEQQQIRKDLGFEKTSFASENARIQELQDQITQYYDLINASQQADEETEAHAKTQVSAYSRIKQVLSGVVSALSSLISISRQAINSLGHLTDSMLEFGASLKSPKEFISKILPTMPGLFRRSKRESNGANISFKKLARTLLRYGFGIRSFYFLFRRLRKALNEGLRNLALFDDELNTNISNLMTALNTLKGSFASAFSPIINIVAPLITQFCNLLATAVDYIGMFLSAIMGKSTYMKAIGIQQDYAASLRDTADSANSAKEAMLDYLSGLDEIRKFPAPDTGSGSGGGGGAGSGADKRTIDFEETEIPNSIKSLVATLKDYIKDQDWEGLGEFLADGVNRGLEKVYDIVSWKNIGPKITPVIDAITGTFNSFVDKVDWEKLGRTVGAGLQTLVNIANDFLTKTDFQNLGKKVATAFNGFFAEINWESVGELLGNKIMVLWDMFNGFVHQLDWGAVGNAISSAITGFFETFNFTTIMDTIATFLNGLATTIGTVASDENMWKTIVDNIGSGIDKFLGTFDWEANGRAVGNFILQLFKTLNGLITYDRVKSLAEGIASFLAQIPWGELFKEALQLMWSLVSGVIVGLWTEESGTGKVIVYAIAGWFTVSKIMPIVSSIKKAFGSSTVNKQMETVGSSLGENLGAAAVAAVGAYVANKAVDEYVVPMMDMLNHMPEIQEWSKGKTPEEIAEVFKEGFEIAKSENKQSDAFNFWNWTLGGAVFAPYVDGIMNATEMILEQKEAVEGVEEAWQKVLTSKAIEKTNNGLAKLRDTGVLTQEKTQELAVQLSKLNRSSPKEIRDFFLNSLIPTIKASGGSIKDLGPEFYDLAVTAGLNLTDINKAFEEIPVAADTNIKKSGTAIETYYKSDKWTNVKEQSKSQIKDSVTGKPQDLTDAGTGNAEKASRAMKDFYAKSDIWKNYKKTAQDEMTNAYKVDPTSKGTDASTKAAKGQRDYYSSSNWTTQKSGIQTNMKAPYAIDPTSDGTNASTKAAKGQRNYYSSNDWITQKSGIQTNMKSPYSVDASTQGSNVSASAAKGEVNYFSTSPWSQYKGYVQSSIQSSLNVDASGQAHSTMGSFLGTINSDYMKNQLYQTGQNAGRQLRNGIANVKMPEFTYTVPKALAQGATTKITGRVQIPMASGGLVLGPTSALVGEAGREAVLPLTNKRSMGIIADAIINGLGNKIASLAHIPIPKLASGAVIPANREFIAQLGDQRNGMNLEAPESMLRQIVREESGNSNYHFTAQINRKTLFDEFIKEAKLRQMQSGRNPFEFA